MANFSKTPTMSNRLAAANVLAHNWHQYQLRKDGTPYIGHLMSVSGLVIEFGGSEDQAIAALFHDSIEDVGKTLQEIESPFGADVAAMVSALTLKKGDPNQNLRYVDALAGCPAAALVSACDKLHNLRGYARGAAAMQPRHAHLYALLIQAYGLYDVPSSIIDELKALLLSIRHPNTPMVQEIVQLSWPRSWFGPGFNQASRITGCNEIGFEAAAVYEDEMCMVVTSVQTTAIAAMIKPGIQANSTTNPVLMVDYAGEIIRCHGETDSLLAHLRTVTNLGLHARKST